MSTTHRVKVWCDIGITPRCYVACPSQAWNSQLARSRARESGWHRNGARDICPACWEAGGR